MPYTYNITFAASPEIEGKMLDYLRKILIPAVNASDYGTVNPQLKKVVEIGGEKPGTEEGVSIAFAAEFSNEEQAHLWHDFTLMPELDNFPSYFGDSALYFITLLESISL